MKSIAIFLLLCPLSVWAQALTPETVVATIDEHPVTAGEIMTVLQNRPPDAQKNIGDGKGLIAELGFVRRLASMGESAHLDQQDPWKKMLQLQREYTMAQAELQVAQDAIPVPAQEQKKFYEDHKDRYTQVKIKLLYVSFNDHPAPSGDPKARKILNEIEAKAKIENLLTQIRGGADFVKLVRANSEDPSRAKDGDYGAPIRRSEKLLPEDGMKAIFSLKVGEVTDPVRTPAGYYLFRLEESIVQPYQEVANDIFIEIRHGLFQKWQEETQKSIVVKIESPDFFKKISSTPAQPPK
jgi:hypothetical protein